jgi:hypothetical protein
MAANRVGKTFSAGGYEMTCHLTGDYPNGGPGKRFRHPIRAWACGKTNETTRDIVQTTCSARSSIAARSSGSTARA